MRSLSATLTPEMFFRFASRLPQLVQQFLEQADEAGVRRGRLVVDGRAVVFAAEGEVQAEQAEVRGAAFGFGFERRRAHHQPRRHRIHRAEQQRFGHVQPTLRRDRRNAEAFARTVLAHDAAQDLHRARVLEDVAVAQVVPRRVAVGAEHVEAARHPQARARRARGLGVRIPRIEQIPDLFHVQRQVQRIGGEHRARGGVEVARGHRGEAAERGQADVEDAFDELLDHDVALLSSKSASRAMRDCSGTDCPM